MQQTMLDTVLTYPEQERRKAGANAKSNKAEGKAMKAAQRKEEGRKKKFASSGLLGSFPKKPSVISDSCAERCEDLRMLETLVWRRLYPIQSR